MDDKELFNLHAAKQGAYKAYDDREYIRLLNFMEFQKQARENKILDVGCGSGAFSFVIAAMGFSVTGVDISEGLINIGKNNIVKGNPDLIVGDFISMDFKKKFDTVFCAAIIHHFAKDLEKCVSKIKSAIKDGGSVYVLEPRGGLKHRILSFLHEKLGNRKTECSDDEDAINVEELNNIFIKEGFSVEAVCYIHRIREHKQKIDGVVPLVKYKIKKFFTQTLFPHPYVYIRYRNTR